MTTNLSTIRAEVAELSDKELILEVVKAIGWTVSEGGHYATKHDGSRFMLADPKVFGHCMLTGSLDLTSDRVQWAALNEVVTAVVENESIVDNFRTALWFKGYDALMIKPRQLCECIAMAQRMRG